MRKKGFTLIELVVGIGILVIVGAAALLYIVNSAEKAHLAQIREQQLHIASAVNSVVTERLGMVEDTDGDGDYLDELVALGALSMEPKVPPCSTWYLKAVQDDQGRRAWYIEIDLENCPPDVKKIFQKLDEQYDDSSPSSGRVRMA